MALFKVSVRISSSSTVSSRCLFEASGGKAFSFASIGEASEKAFPVGAGSANQPESSFARLTGPAGEAAKITFPVRASGVNEPGRSFAKLAGPAGRGTIRPLPRYLRTNCTPTTRSLVRDW